MGGMMLTVKSPQGDLAKAYDLEIMRDAEHDSVEVFLSKRCLDRAELLYEISHELAQVRHNYEEVCKRLKAYEPDFVPPAETEYCIEDRLVSL